jgi:hypothetical protein
MTFKDIISYVKRMTGYKKGDIPVIGSELSPGFLLEVGADGTVKTDGFEIAKLKRTRTYILARRSTAQTCGAGDTIMYYNTEDYDTLGEFTTDGSFSIFQPATDKLVCIRMQTYVKSTPPTYGVEPYIEVANVGSSTWSLLTKTNASHAYGYNVNIVGRDTWIFKTLQGKKYRFKTYINPGRDLYTSADGNTYATNVEIIELLGEL